MARTQYKFREDKHKRSPDGKFTTKPGVASGTPESKKKKRPAARRPEDDESASEDTEDFETFGYRVGSIGGSSGRRGGGGTQQNPDAKKGALQSVLSEIEGAMKNGNLGEDERKRLEDLRQKTEDEIQKLERPSKDDRTIAERRAEAKQKEAARVAGSASRKRRRMLRARGLKDIDMDEIELGLAELDDLIAVKAKEKEEDEDEEEEMQEKEEGEKEVKNKKKKKAKPKSDGDDGDMNPSPEEGDADDTPEPGEADSNFMEDKPPETEEDAEDDEENAEAGDSGKAFKEGQKRYPKGTPGGLGGQWMPEGEGSGKLGARGILNYLSDADDGDYHWKVIRHIAKAGALPAFDTQDQIEDWISKIVTDIAGKGAYDKLAKQDPENLSMQKPARDQEKEKEPYYKSVNKRRSESDEISNFLQEQDEKRKKEQYSSKGVSILTLFESGLHKWFTITADDLYRDNHLTREERIALSSAIGAALERFSEVMPEVLGQAGNRNPYAEVGPVDLPEPNILAAYSDVYGFDGPEMVKSMDTSRLSEFRPLPDVFAAKSLASDRFGGYLILWGDERRKDITGEWFTKSTAEIDTVFNSIGAIPAVYHHAADNVMKSTVIGAIDTMEMDSIGVWVEAQVSNHKAYKQFIEPLIEKKVLGWSSGTFPRARQVAKSGEILRWPTLEGSLTPAPAEYRMLTNYPVSYVKTAFAQAGLEFPGEFANRELSLEKERIAVLELEFGGFSDE